MRFGTPQARRAAAVMALIALLVVVPAAPAAAALITQDDEVRIGRQAAAQLEAEVGLSTDREAAARLRAVGQRIAAVSTRRNLPYTFKVIRGRDVNAISLPGGFIYATEALMRFVESEAELSFIMGHEVGHVSARHHVTMLERQMLFSLLSQVLLGRDSGVAQLGQIARALVARGYSRENEYEADRIGLGYAHHAGFAASAALDFMTRLRAAQGRDPDRFEVLLRTHPALVDRIQRVRDELRALGYRVPARP